MSERQSKHINRTPAVNIHHATRYAERRGLPLNTFVTVNFTELGISSGASRMLRRLLSQRFSPWLRRSAPVRPRPTPTYVWAIENTTSTIAAHWLVHIPNGAKQAFGKKLVSWLRDLAGVEPQPKSIQVKRVYNVIGARRYILKGINPIWAAHLGVRPSNQGLINGKRTGFSRNLGPTARRAGGYAPRRSVVGSSQSAS
jgi:hypothetical protein